MDKICTQGKELGVYTYLMTGGEPLVRKADILKLAEKHNDCYFHIFTNSTLIDQAFCDEVKRLGNLSFALSVEGTKETTDGRRGAGCYDKVMEDLKKKPLFNPEGDVDVRDRRLINFNTTNLNDFNNMFEVVIQFGSILAVILLYFHRLNPFSPKKSAVQKKKTWTLWLKVLIATVPAAIAGYFLDDIIDAKFRTPLVIAIALIVYGVLFIVIENRRLAPSVVKAEDMYFGSSCPAALAAVS